MSTLPEKGLQLRSLIKPEGELELSLVEVDLPTPGPGDVIIMGTPPGVGAARTPNRRSRRSTPPWPTIPTMRIASGAGRTATPSSPGWCAMCRG